MPPKRLLLVALSVLLLSVPAGAQDLALSIERGLVTVRAKDARLEVLLRQWSEITGLVVVSRGDISGIRLTLELTGVSEREALAILLRDANGYVVGETRDPSTGLPALARLVVVGQATSTGVAGPAFRASTPPSQTAREQVPLGLGEDDAAVQAEDQIERPEPGLAQGGDGAGVAEPDVAMPLAPTSDAQPATSAAKGFGSTATAERPGMITAAPESASPPMSSEEILRRSQLPKGVPQVFEAGASSATP